MTLAAGKRGDPAAAAAYQATLDGIKAVMGAAFAARFDRSVADSIDAWPRARAGS